MDNKLDSSKLPKRLSALIKLAVSDCKKVARDKNYTPNMDTWFDGENTFQACQVCMAGAVMAKTCKVNINVHINPAYFSDSAPFYAIDYARRGYVINALDCLDQHYRIGPKRQEAIHKAELYIKTKMIFGLGRAPWAAYLKVANELEAVGL